MFLVNGTLEEFSIKTLLFLKLDYLSFWQTGGRKPRLKKQTDAKLIERKTEKKMLKHNLENYKGCSVNKFSDRQF